MDGEIWTQGTPRPPAAKSSNTHEDGHLASDKRVRPLATGYGQRTADSKGSAVSRCAAGKRRPQPRWVVAPACTGCVLCAHIDIGEAHHPVLRPRADLQVSRDRR
jgi:hypothetical protein